MFKKLFKLLLLIILLLAFVKPSLAQENQVNLYLFWGDGCPHCASEKGFLTKLNKEYSNLKLYEYEVWNNSQNRYLLTQVGEKLNTQVSGVPFTVIGDIAYVGYSEGTISNQIEDKVKYCTLNKCPDSVGKILGLSDPNTEEISQKQQVPGSGKLLPDKISVPIIGELDIKNLSLPVFAIVLGTLDGFNPCAMWALIFLISLLLGIHDKKRRWILGTAFILSSAFVYFIFMAAWLNVLIFIGYIVWVRLLIGGVAIAGGIFNLREFLVNKDNSCKVTGGEKRRHVFERLKKVTHNQKFFLALLGIIALAFSVNLVELICSAGLPVIFTQVLALSDLSTWQYYAYMLLYIFFFMLDDLFVFFTAMITLEVTGISTKYSKYSHLIGGILMLIIGLILILKPGWLMFG